MRFSAISLVFASGLLLAATGAMAESTPTDTTTPAAAPTATPAPAAAPTTSDDDAVTCRYEKTTGSLFSKRVCHTQREWKQMTTDSRDLMDRIDDHSRMGGVGGN